MEIGVLYNSQNYEQFNYIEVNRDVKKSHILELATKIRKKNLLHLSPMIVNGNMDVFDGQHRLGAAKMLGVKIYYLYDPNVTHEDIITLNTTSDSWKPLDFLKFYTVKQVPGYAKLAAFLKNNPKLAIDTTLWLMAPVDKRYSSLMQNFKAGLINIANYDHAAEVASVLMTLCQLEGVSKRLIYKSELIYAISTTKMQGIFNMDKLTRKLQQEINLFMACETQNDYLQLLRLTFTM